MDTEWLSEDEREYTGTLIGKGNMVVLLRERLVAERQKVAELEREIERLYTKRFHPATVAALQRAEAADAKVAELVEALQLLRSLTPVEDYARIRWFDAVLAKYQPKERK